MMGTEETLTTSSRCPDSRAESTASSEAFGSNGASSVASITGRGFERLVRSTVVMPMSSVERISSGLVGPEVPTRRAFEDPPCLAATELRYDKQRPCRDQPEEKDRELDSHEGCDGQEDRGGHQWRTDREEPIAIDAAQKRRVLLLRDLVCVPAPIAFSTVPPRPISRASRGTAVARDR